MKKSLLLALLLLLSTSGLRAADFWKERDYKQWKPKEAHKMLNKSPWAQNVSLDPMRMRRAGFGDIEGDPTQDPAERRSPAQPRGSVEALAGDPNPVPVGAAPAGGGPGFNSSGLAGRPPTGWWRSGAASHQCNRPLGQRPSGETGRGSVPLPGELRGVGKGQAASQLEGRAVRGPVERPARQNSARPAKKH